MIPSFEAPKIKCIKGTCVHGATRRQEKAGFSKVDHCRNHQCVTTIKCHIQLLSAVYMDKDGGKTNAERLIPSVPRRSSASGSGTQSCRRERLWRGNQNIH